MPLESPHGGPHDGRQNVRKLAMNKKQDQLLRTAVFAPYPPGFVDLRGNEELQQRRLEQLAQRGLSPVEFDHLEAGRRRRGV